MKQYFDDIRTLVESGEYYADALDWYQHKFIYPVIERAYFTLGLMMLAAVAFLVSAVYEVIQPFHKEVTFISNVQDKTKFYSHLTPVNITTEGEESRVQAEQAILKTVLREYVRAFEQYDFREDFAQLRANNTLIASYSSEAIARNYAERTSMSNPSSLIFQLKRATRIDVVLRAEDVALEALPADPVVEEGKAPMQRYRAVVPFTAVYVGEGARKASMVAELEVSFSGIAYDREKEDYLPYTLTVTNYASKAIAN